MPVSVTYSHAKSDVERFAYNLDAYQRAFDRLPHRLKTVEE